MAKTKTLLIIAHAPSSNTIRMLDAVVKGAKNREIYTVDVQSLTPLDVQPKDILSADAVIIGTTENFGYLAGLIKDVFDRCYYHCIEKTDGLPFTFYIRAGHDGLGAKRALETITSGLKWKLVQKPLICRGKFENKYLEECEELGLSMAASLEAEII